MASICEEGGEGGLVFPAVSNEYEWPGGLRATLYLIGLGYFFLGVAIIADIFMSSIETVTAKRIQKINRKDGHMRTHKLWNETVATLTLMALGSSAPEIFLSVIDMVKKDFHFTALGASTIVGSASFNLLVIVAVCVIAIPKGEHRQIENLPAFYITALFSLVAYLWMAFILTESTPSIVDVWEAVVTLLLLPALIWVSWKTDKGDADWILRKMRIIPAESEKESNEEGEESFVTFENEVEKVMGMTEESSFTVKVLRSGSAIGPVSMSYRTEGMSAIAGHDFEELDGCLEFEAGETMKTLELKIFGREHWRVQSRFLLLLEDVEGQGAFHPDRDGEEEAAILTVILDRSPGHRGGFKHIVDGFLGVNMLAAAWDDWKDQWSSVFWVNGSKEEQAEAGAADWVMHCLSLPWRFIFCLLPPTSLMGGWPCFLSSLCGIAIFTACVSDLAEVFGCICNVPDIVTAITFVALGTSMPDLFASLSAAREDPTADASVVNVTGSNSVNVYLGLGLPWTLASVYWQTVGRTAEWEARYPVEAAMISGVGFVVESKNLGFSVLTFCVVCCLALLILHLRRKWLGGELGGPVGPKIATTCVLIGFWSGWVALVSHRVLRWEEHRATETMAVQGMAGILTGIATLGLFFYMRSYRGVFEQEQEAALAASAAKELEAQPVKVAGPPSGTKSASRSRSRSRSNDGLEAPNMIKIHLEIEDAGVVIMGPEDVLQATV